jgi:hypothetical protein
LADFVFGTDDFLELQIQTAAKTEAKGIPQVLMSQGGRVSQWDS